MIQLHHAVHLFQQHFHCKLPSRIRLSSKLADMEEESLAVLRQVFPQRAFWATWERQDMVWNDQAPGLTTVPNGTASCPRWS